MTREDKSAAGPIMAVFATLLVMMGMYVGGYYWFSETWYCPVGYVRQYTYKWQASLFYPASQIESWYFEDNVMAIWPEEPGLPDSVFDRWDR